MSCDPFRHLAESQISNAVLGVGGLRRDVAANIGDATNYQNRPWFLMDRQLSSAGDQLYVRAMKSDATWGWLFIVEFPADSGGFFP